MYYNGHKYRIRNEVIREESLDYLSIGWISLQLFDLEFMMTLINLSGKKVIYK